MKSLDFVYDGKSLSDYNFIICDFNSSNGVTEVESGSVITFNKISTNGGMKHIKESFIYDQCIAATFDICKNDELFGKEEMEISSDEFRTISRWLNRKDGFHKFNLVYQSGETVKYFNASFNLKKLKIADKLYGIRLSMETDAPFAYGNKVTTLLQFTSANQTLKINNTSDEIGDIYPELKITCSSNGDLKLENKTNDLCSTIIYGCNTNEVINIDNENGIIQTNSINHDIYDCFNYDFFKLTNSLDSKENSIKASLPCSVEISYVPIIKDGL